MSKIHFLLRPSRSGWFNFTLISEAGRLTGTVIVPQDGKSQEEREQQARDKIHKLAEAFSREQSRPAANLRPRRLHELGQGGSDR